MRKLFIVGMPSLYGGAGSELYHQIILWSKIKELELHIIPTYKNFQNEALYEEMVKLNIKFEEPMCFESVSKDDAVINFCSGDFLNSLEKIKQFTDKIMFVNCMTWLHEGEKKNASKDLIKYYLYQRPQIRDDHATKLRLLGSNAEFIHFIPYFHSELFEYKVEDKEFSHLGRISRADTDKYSKDICHIYEYIVSPKMKKGHFLGFDEGTAKKINNIPSWINKYRNQNELPINLFYDLVDIIVQPTETTENWPRIGFEAMHSGKPLIVDNRGGWKYMIEHGVDGFLCDTPRDFIYYGSRMCYDLDFRNKIAENAKRKAEQLGGFDQSLESWNDVFEQVYE